MRVRTDGVNGGAPPAASAVSRRLLAAIRMDVLLQARNQLVAISAGVAILVGGLIAWLASADAIPRVFPVTVLMFVGGSTLLYVMAMLILERSQGTLSALVVSPLRSGEYLASKVITLTGLATLEAVIIGALSAVVLWRAGVPPVPNPVALVGVIALGVVHVFIGVVLTAPHERLSDVLLPVGGIATILQLPALYFAGAWTSPVLLAIPSGPPTMLVMAGYTTLSAWQWAYALVGTTAVLVGFGWWAERAFIRHIVRAGG